MAKLGLTQTFIDDFEEIGESGKLELLGEMVEDLKNVEKEIADISLEEYIKLNSKFHQVDGNGYVYRFKDLRLIAIIEEEEMLFIGILSEMTRKKSNDK